MRFLDGRHECQPGEESQQQQIHPVNLRSLRFAHRSVARLPPIVQHKRRRREHLGCSRRRRISFSRSTRPHAKTITVKGASVNVTSSLLHFFGLSCFGGSGRDSCCRAAAGGVDCRCCSCHWLNFCCCCCSCCSLRGRSGGAGRTSGLVSCGGAVSRCCCGGRNSRFCGCCIVPLFGGGVAFRFTGTVRVSG